MRTLGFPSAIHLTGADGILVDFHSQMIRGLPSTDHLGWGAWYGAETPSKSKPLQLEMPPDSQTPQVGAGQAYLTSSLLSF